MWGMLPECRIAALNEEKHMDKVVGNKIIEGILVILLGLFLLFNPEGSMNIVLMIIGIILLVMAVGGLISYKRNVEERTRSALAIAIVQIIFGLVLVIIPKLLTNFAFIVFALFIGFGAILSLSRAAKSKKAGIPVSKFSVILAILTLILAVIVLFNPGFIANFAVQLVGIALIVEGITIFAAPSGSRASRR